MGVFGNDDPGVGTRLGPGVEAPGMSGFAAMGKPVPMYRRQAGHDACVEMGLNAEQAFSAVSIMSQYLERDEPWIAMEKAFKYLDATGVYRLMAILLTAERNHSSTVERAAHNGPVAGSNPAGSTKDMSMS